MSPKNICGVSRGHLAGQERSQPLKTKSKTLIKKNKVRLINNQPVIADSCVPFSSWSLPEWIYWLFKLQQFDSVCPTSLLILITKPKEQRNKDPPHNCNELMSIYLIKYRMKWHAVNIQLTTWLFNHLPERKNTFYFYLEEMKIFTITTLKLINLLIIKSFFSQWSLTMLDCICSCQTHSCCLSFI